MEAEWTFEQNLGLWERLSGINWFGRTIHSFANYDVEVSSCVSPRGWREGLNEVPCPPHRDNVSLISNTVSILTVGLTNIVNGLGQPIIFALTPRKSAPIYAIPSIAYSQVLPPNRRQDPRVSLLSMESPGRCLIPFNWNLAPNLKGRSNWFLPSIIFLVSPSACLESRS